MKREKVVNGGKVGVMNRGVQKSGRKKTVMRSIITTEVFILRLY